MLAYSWIIFVAFGLVITVEILWGEILMILISALADTMLLRLIITQPIRTETEKCTILEQTSAHKLESYIGTQRWEALVEISRAIDLAESIDPSSLAGDDAK